MRISFFTRVHLLVLPVLLVAETVWAQSPRPIVPSGRSEQSGGSANFYVSSTLPPTGHATSFKKYASAPPAGTTLQRQRPSVGTYLNLTRPGNPALNYFLGFKRDQEIYNTGAQVQQVNTQVGGIREDFRTAPRRPYTSGESRGDDLTPLQRKTMEQRGELLDETKLLETLRKLSSAQDENSQQEQAVFKAILDELKGIRENLSPKSEPAKEKKAND